MNCHICNEPLTGRFYQDVWDNKVCEAHINNDVVHCSSCTGFTRKEHCLPDGRCLCKSCFGIAVKAGTPIEKIVKYVVVNLNKVGFDDLRLEDMTIEIVPAQKIAEILNSTVVNVLQKGITKSYIIEEVFSAPKFKHDIYMLTHLTNIEFAGSLAHEMLHTWQTQNNIVMSQKHIEGFCNMGAWLMWNNLPNPLTKVYLKTLFKNTNPIYGDGFREMYAHYERLGWKVLIDKVRKKTS